MGDTDEIGVWLMRYCLTSLCNDQCACRRVADKAEIVEVVSDKKNHVMEKRQLREMIAERRRLKNEASQMGIQ